MKFLAIFVAYSDDRGLTFSRKQQLNVAKGTFPDHPQMAVDPSGRVVVVWEEQSPVRREVVVSWSLDRAQTFGSPQKVNEKGARPHRSRSIPRACSPSPGWNMRCPVIVSSCRRYACRP